MNKSDQITYKALEHYAAELKQELDDVQEQMKHLNLNGVKDVHHAAYGEGLRIREVQIPGERYKRPRIHKPLLQKTAKRKGRSWTAEQRAAVGLRIKRYWQKRRQAS